MMMNAQNFVNDLALQDNLSESWALVGELANKNPDLLIEYYSEISKRYTDSKEQWAFGSMLERILEVLCLTNGLKQVKAVLAIVSHEAADSTLRKIAAMLAAGQKFDHLANEVCQLEPQPNILEFTCLLAQELVLRKIDITQHEAFCTFVQACHRHHSLFGRLPLKLTAIEEKPSQRIYRIGVTAFGSSFGLPHDAAYVEVETKDIPIQLETNDLVLTALEGWRQQSNGELIGLRGTFGHADFTASELIIAIHNQYHEQSTNQLKIQVRSLKEVFSMVHGASTNGGAYSGGELGAVGRLKTWHTLAAMAGLHFSEVTCSEIIEELTKYEFYEFLTNSSWFYDHILDLGILALNRQDKTFSLLVAKDTD